MFVNIRSRTQVVRHVRAGISVDMEPIVVGGALVQPTYIEVTYRFDSLRAEQQHEVVVTANVMRRNGTVSERHVPITWPEGHPDMPEWAARFLRDHRPSPMGLI